MADQDTTVKVENGEEVDTSVETGNTEDENVDTSSQEDTSTDTGKDENESESTDEGGESTDETEDEGKVEFKKRFTQFEGETLEDYVKKLEDGYAASSTEGQRKAIEAKKATEKFDQVAKLIASDPALAKKLSEATGEDAPKVVNDPALDFARQQMEESYKKDFDAFSAKHPDLADEPEKLQSLIEEMDIIAAAHEKRGNRLTMAQGLQKAWVSLGYDETDSKDDVINKTKEQASSTSTTKGKPSPRGDQFTPEQIAVAKKMGLTPKQLAEYNK